jgi:hypothetical protein
MQVHMRMACARKEGVSRGARYGVQVLCRLAQA